jgi:hypothetical protein
MATREMEIEVSLAWWMPIYINVLAFICVVTGNEPDPEKVERMMERPIRLKAVYK